MKHKKTKNIFISLFIVQFFLLSAVFVQSYDTVDIEEDFGFFTDKYKGILFWLGVGYNDTRANLHTPWFLPDERAINIGVEIFFKLI